MKTEKTLCETPTPGKKPTRIDTWKYEAVKRAIIDVLNQRPEGVLFSDLTNLIGDRLKPQERAELRSIG